ncbi:hypothetical protein HKD37_17G048633 [Glycine soja]
MNFAARKPVEFTQILVSYADLLSYLLDNLMVAITLAKVHQPPFLREYDSNATCACHREAPGRSIEHCRALKRKVDPWVLVPITFRGLYVLAIRGLHILACKGLHALTFRGLRILIFIPGPPLDIGGRQTVRAHPEREAITHLLCIPRQDLTSAAAKRRVRIMRTNMTTLTWIWMMLLFSNILPSDHNANLPLQMYQLDGAHKTPSGPEEVQQGPGVSSSGYRPLDRAHKTPSGPEEVQQGPGVSSSGYGPLSVLYGAHSPSKESHPQRHPVDPENSNRAPGFPAMGSCPQDTQWTRRSPTGSWSCQALITGLYQFYGVPVAPSKVIRSPTNRAFIKKYCVPRQAQGETP